MYNSICVKQLTFCKIFNNFNEIYNLLCYVLYKHDVKWEVPMKISWSLWWIISSIEILSFLVFAVFLWMRDIDASGVTQTTELKIINVGVLGLAYLIPMVIQIIWLIINLVYSKKAKRKYIGIK